MKLSCPCFWKWPTKKAPEVRLLPLVLWTRKRTEHFSPLMLRILAVNVMALAILVGSLLYLGRYKDRLVASEIDGLMVQARLSASAIAEGAVVMDQNEQSILSPLLARIMIRRLVEANDTRTRLYDTDDALVADSQILMDRVEKMRVRGPQRSKLYRYMAGAAMKFFDYLDRFLSQQEFTRYTEDRVRNGDQYEIVRMAQSGFSAAKVWDLPDGRLLLTVAVPVQRYKQVLGSILLSRPDMKINASIRAVRVDILKIFGVTLFITFLLSFYLARAIARPLKQLAKAVESVRRGQMKLAELSATSHLLGPDAIPDFSDRNDEIGDLSVAMREMTAALAKRIGAIENFAADVAHEIKNPLTSLRSAVETAERISDPERQKQLMQVIRDDVMRLDRLISDISNASRLDSELTRDEAAPVDLVQMLTTLVDFYSSSSCAVRVALREGTEKLMAPVVESRLVQVVQNLVSNAMSFSPTHSTVWLSVAVREKGWVAICVDDEGHGIPENKLEAIFDRFYSERPKNEKFGTHSGLGLSISKQIVEAHKGRIWAENRKDERGRIIGARFVVCLPTLPIV